MTAYRRSFWQLFMVLIAFNAGLVVFAGLDRPLWGDEAHFVQTVRQFGRQPTLDTLEHYNEMPGPLTFVLYGLWGRLFGFRTSVLRLLSMLLAMAAYLLFHRLLFDLFGRSAWAILTTLYFAFNPYMIGLGFFVYTDMLAIVLMLLCCLAVKDGHAVGLAAASACALITRQYLAFVTLAAMGYHAALLLRQREKSAAGMLLAAAVSFLPLALLAFLWHGLSPANAVRQSDLSAAFVFHAGFDSFYIGLFFLYLLPFVWLARRLIYGSRRVLAACLLASPLYFLFPVTPGPVLLAADIHTVGFGHRLLNAVFGQRQLLVHGVFYLLFTLGLPVCWFLCNMACQRWKNRGVDFFFFLSLMVLAFLAIMPFSWMCWEKYFLPMVPVGAVLMLQSLSEATEEP